ncbi:hypothetical protein KKD95_00685 [Patescibacteria group bacterium]|nr:hypothetical protein [Patescibacteria group bacterium]
MDQEDTQIPEEASVGDAVASLMKELPEPVQDFIASDERTQIVRDLSQKHSLHTDQAGDFEQALLFMLLGISTPDQFVEALKKAGLTEDVVNGLVEDVNAQIFMRLREAEQRPAPVQKPAPLPPPAIEYTPPKTPASLLPGTSVPVPAPQPPPVYEPAAIEPTPQPIHQTQVMQGPAPATHPAGWHPAAAVHVYIPTHPAAHQPVPEPIAPAPAPTPTPTPAPAPVQQPVSEPVRETPPPPRTASPIEKTYSADPYREPVE